MTLPPPAIWKDPRTPAQIAARKAELRLAAQQSAVDVLTQMAPSRDRDAALDRAKRNLARLTGGDVSTRHRE